MYARLPFEPNELFRAFTETRVIVTGHTHVRFEPRKTASSPIALEQIDRLGKWLGTAPKALQVYRAEQGAAGAGELVVVAKHRT